MQIGDGWLVAVIVLTGVAGVGLLAILVRGRNRYFTTWMRLAKATHTLDITRKPGDGITLGPAVLTGTLHGVSVGCELFGKGHGEREARNTRVSAWSRRAMPKGFMLARQGHLFGVARALGARDVETGDGEFDKAFVVQCTYSLEAKRLFADRTMRAKLVELVRMHPDLVVDGGHVSIEKGFIVWKEDMLRSMLDAVAQTASMLDHAAQRLPAGS